jgi:hypothetical protein
MGGSRAKAWTDARIRGELREFLAGRDEWPTYRERQAWPEAVPRVSPTVEADSNIQVAA